MSEARLKELFIALIELDESQRESFMDRECGDDLSLRQELESLLGFHRPDENDSLHTRADVDLRGKEIAGRYRIENLVGSGGMGKVYRAHDTLLDTDVALKLLTGSSSRDIEHLRREVRLARRVAHPNVCRVFDVVEDEGHRFLTMELVDGSDLASVRRRIGPVSAETLASIARQLCAGLAAIHACDIVHRDLKPANVLLDSNGKLRITDFGIAAGEDAPQGPVASLGTPAYMAPEQLAGAPASVASDLYALGLVLHEMSSGEQVFRADSVAEYAKLHRERPPSTPSGAAAHSPELTELILRCLAKDPDDRPGSAMEVALGLPGSDPLRLAIEAGITLEPELLARIPEARTSTPRLALMATIALVFVLAIPWITDRNAHLVEASSVKAPEVLADRADQLLRGFGHPPPVDRAWGYFDGFGEETGADAYQFWYRESPSPMMAADLYRVMAGDQRIDYGDPPLLEIGAVQLVLNGTGELIDLQAIPLARAPDEPSTELDWQAVLAAGGFDPELALETEPMVRSFNWIDQQRAWWIDGDEEGIHVDAASADGRLVYFDADAGKLDRVELSKQFESRATIEAFALAAAFLALALAAGLLARSNLKRGRGDRLGAQRAAFIAGGLSLAVWAIDASHIPDLDYELISLRSALARSLLEALVIWILYLALEPMARRHFPGTLRTWSRLLRHGPKGIDLGVDLIAGIAIGAGWAFMWRIEGPLIAALGLGPSFPEAYRLVAAVDARSIVTTLVIALSIGLWGGLTWMFTLALAQRVSGRRWLAIGVFVVGVTAITAIDGNDPLLAAILVGLPVALSSLWLLLRRGVLALILAIAVEHLLTFAPTTYDSSAWFFSAGAFAIITLLAALAYAAWSISGSPASTSEA